MKKYTKEDYKELQELGVPTEILNNIEDIPFYETLTELFNSGLELQNEKFEGFDDVMGHMLDFVIDKALFAFYLRYEITILKSGKMIGNLNIEL